MEYINFDFFCILYLLLYIVTFGNNTNVVKVVMVKVVKLDFWKYFFSPKDNFFLSSDFEFDHFDHDHFDHNLQLTTK